MPAFHAPQNAVKKKIINRPLSQVVSRGLQSNEEPRSKIRAGAVDCIESVLGVLHGDYLRRCMCRVLRTEKSRRADGDSVGYLPIELLYARCP